LDLPEDYRIEKTVFIKAPRSIAYGEVARMIDLLKGAGAEPVGLQLDGLN
jgi:biopolymer transport protein ExbD